ncbi:hypothetical protein EMPG_14801 [Blastomyces silverae]|uniref:Uncharacterized protein n=1 Tax=Blastomyces silverae TaxID=2060906 RepID=A0A0H1BF59_9EURO|nr:hypothetical protein EMPG_14801 [Blastomyces silverae]
MTRRAYIMIQNTYRSFPGWQTRSMPPSSKRKKDERDRNRKIVVLFIENQARGTC